MAFPRPQFPPRRANYSLGEKNSPRQSWRSNKFFARGAMVSPKKYFARGIKQYDRARLQRRLPRCRVHLRPTRIVYRDYRAPNQILTGRCVAKWELRASRFSSQPKEFCQLILFLQLKDLPSVWPGSFLSAKVYHHETKRRAPTNGRFCCICSASPQKT